MTETNDVSVVSGTVKKKDISETKPVLRFANGSRLLTENKNIPYDTRGVLDDGQVYTRAHHGPVRPESTIYFPFFSSRLFRRRIPYGSLFKGVPVKCASVSVVRVQSAMWNRTRIYFVSAVGFRSLPLRPPFPPPSTLLSNVHINGDLKTISEKGRERESGACAKKEYHVKRHSIENIKKKYESMFSSIYISANHVLRDVYTFLKNPKNNRRTVVVNEFIVLKYWTAMFR